MLGTVTKAQQTAYDHMYRLWKSASASDSYMRFRELARTAYNFYDGIQWTKEEEAQLRERRQAPVVVNLIKSPIDTMSGTEIQTRVKIGFKSVSSNEEDTLFADAVTEFALTMQEHENVSFQQSQKYRDALICGIGWSHQYKEDYKESSERILYERVDPLSVVFDPDDLTDQFTNSSFVARYGWYSLNEAIALFPNWEAELRKRCDEWEINGSPGAQGSAAGSRNTNDISLFYDTFSNRLMIVEMQYRKKTTIYHTVTANNKFIQTYDKEDAEEVAKDPNLITSEEGTRIYRGFFTQDILLEHKPMNVMLDKQEFTYTPIVMNRRYYDGVPYGKVYSAIDPQKEYNKRRSKMLHLLNSNAYIIDHSATNGEKIEQLRQELARPDAIIINHGGMIQRIDNPSIQGQFELLQKSEMEVLRAIGSSSEALGQNSNATSGVAIRERQINSVRNEIPSLDNLMLMKKREGKVLLAFLKTIRSTNLLSQVVRDDDKVEAIILNNEIKTPDGYTIIENDIRTENLEVVADEIDDFAAPAEMQAQQLMQILAMPQAQLILSNPVLMRRLGISDANKLAETWKQVLAEGMAEQSSAGSLPNTSNAKNQGQLTAVTQGSGLESLLK